MISGVGSGIPSNACPLPPPDLAVRQIPVKELDLAATSLLRIDLTKFSPLYFNRRSRASSISRFDAPNDEYGVLYCSPYFDVCMAEALIRERFQSGPLLLDECAIEERSISEVRVADKATLRLVDLTAPLFAIGGSTQIMADPDYKAPNLWSLELHNHPGNFDGLHFSSRFTNLPAIALYERIEVERSRTLRLKDDPRLAPFLDKYEIGLI